MKEAVKRFLLSMIKGYQTYISPQRPGCCRYTPTCSQYTMEALEKHGIWRGILLGAWRILRCNPFSKGGYDPVPETFLPTSKRQKEQALAK